MSGGVAVNVGFDDNKGKSSKGPSKELVDRLSKRPDREPKAPIIEKPKSAEKTQSRAADGTRLAMKVNPVTGKMTTVDPKSNEGKVREGCMMIDEKYLRAAAAAGLGGSNGMYAHMSGVQRELRGGHNVGGGGVPRPKPSEGHQPTVSNVSGRIHKIDTTSSAPKNNIKQVVQGRSRSVNKPTETTHESSYARQKGVVSHLGGCTSSKSQSVANNKDRKTGVATLGSSGGRSYIKTEKKVFKKEVVKAEYEKEPRTSITKKLGGGGSSSTAIATRPSSGGVDMTDREKRAAFFAEKFGK